MELNEASFINVRYVKLVIQRFNSKLIVLGV
jgi:hypothetical protein